MAGMTRTLLAACALLLASCGPKALALPEQLVDRAATCGVVAAAEARAATDINAPLSFEATARILHYPLLAGSAGESFSSDIAAAVQKRMSELQDSITDAHWQQLIPACRSAFPATTLDQAALPEDRYQAQLGCDELGDFMRSALEEQNEFDNELSEYRRLSTSLDEAVGSALRSRVGADLEAQNEARRKALAAMAKAGPPIAVMRECVARFG